MFKFISNLRIIDLLENKTVLHSNKIPNYLSNKNLEEFGYSILSFCKSKTSKEREIYLKVYEIFSQYKLKDLFIFKEENIKCIPIINKKNTELMGIIYTTFPREKMDEFVFFAENEFSEFNMIKKLYINLLNILIELNSNNIMITDDISLLDVYSTFFDNFVYSDSINTAEQEKIISSEFFNNIIKNEKYDSKQLFLFFSSDFISYLKNINLSSEYAIGYENLKKLITDCMCFDAPHVVTVERKKLDSVRDTSNCIETKLGHYYMLNYGIAEFIFDDKFDQEYIKGFLFKVFDHINDFNIIKSSSKGPVILYDKDNFEIKGYLFMSPVKKKIEPLLKIEYIIDILSRVTKTVDISKLNLNSISTVDNVNALSHVENWLCEEIAGYDAGNQNVIDCHNEDLFSINESANANQTAEIVRICFECFNNKKSKKKLINFLPKNIKSLYEEYIRNNKVLEISSDKAEEIINTFNNLIKGASDKIPITKFSPIYVNFGDKVEKKGYEYFNCNERTLSDILEQKKKLKSFVSPKVSFVVYEDTGTNMGICISGILCKKIKTKYVPITDLLLNDTFFKSNYGALMLHLLFEKFMEDNHGMENLPENLGLDMSTYEFGVSEIWNGKVKVSYIRKKLEELLEIKIDYDQFRPLHISRSKGVYYLSESADSKRSLTSSIKNLKNLLLKGNLGYCKDHNVYYLKDYRNICPNCLDESICIENTDELEGIINNTKKTKCTIYSYNLDDIAIPKNAISGNNNFVKFDKKIIMIKGNKYEAIGYTYEINLSYKAVMCTGNLSEYSNRDVLGIVIAVKKFEEKLPKDIVFPWHAITNIFLDFCVLKAEEGLTFEVKLRNLGLLELCGPVEENNNSLKFIDFLVSSFPGIYPNLSITELEREYREMSAYCKIHNIWYNPKNECEICKKDSVNFLHFSIEGKETFNSGGESNVYEIDENHLLKVWKSNKVLLNQKYEIVKRLISESFASKPYNGYDVKLMLPCSMYRVHEKDNEYTIGYNMEKVEDAKPLRNLEDVNIVNEFGFELKDILKILINLGMGISYLHEKGWYIGDLSGNNILFKEDCSVYILDCDSFGCDTIKSTAFTPGYVDPLAITDGNVLRTSKNSDCYSYAVVAFLILTRMHPFKGVYYKGEKRVTDVSERMKEGISVLGNHNIKLPKHIKKEEAWGWMSESLKNSFLKIFETSERFNIVNALTEEYYRITKESESENLEQPKQEVDSKEEQKKEIQVFKARTIKHDVSKIDRGEVFLGLNSNGMVVTISTNSNIDYYKMPKDYIIKYSNSSNTKGYAMINQGAHGLTLNKFSFNSNSNKVISNEIFEDISNFDFIVSNNENNDIYFCVCSKNGITVKFESYSTFTLGKIFNVLSDHKNQQFLLLSADKKVAYIIGNGSSMAQEVDMSTFPECIMTKNNYCFYNNSLYIPMDGKVFCKNIFNGKEKMFEAYSLVASETEMLIQTPSGFRAFARDYILDITS